MDKCLHPSCSCKAYKEPKGSKGTLLQLKTGCESCGHQASLHRKPTSIDRYIQNELKKAKKFSCQCLIPAHEIPQSPLFEPYDLIPLPSDDQFIPSSREGGVQCTCKGFESDLVRLWQKFRTHNMDSVRVELPKATCAFCRHALSEHLTHESMSESSITPPLRTEHAQQTSLLRKTYGQLKLQASANVAVPVALGNDTTALQLPISCSIEECKRISALVLHRVSGDSKLLELSLVTHEFRSLEQEGGIVSDDTQSLPNDEASVCQNGTESMSVSSTGLDRRGHSSEKSVPTAEEEGEGGDTCNKSHPSGKKGRKRKSSENKSPAVPETKRRSARIAEKKVREQESKKNRKLNTAEEMWLKKMKRSRGIKLATLYEERVRSEIEIEPLSQPEVKYLTGNTVQFVRSLRGEATFRSCGTLPQALSKESHVIMATHPVELLQCSRDGKDMSSFLSHPSSSSSPSSFHQLSSLTLVAVASEGSCDVYAAPLLFGGEHEQPLAVWESLSSTAVSVSAKITSLSWIHCAQESSIIAYLAVGYGNGVISVWRCRLHDQRNQFLATLNRFEEAQLLVCVQDTSDQITVCRWSPDKGLRTLAAATIEGDVLFYSIDLEKSALANTDDVVVAEKPSLMSTSKTAILKHFQTVHVSGGCVRCVAWSRDNRLVAVGGSDDYVQVLQRKEPNISSSRPIAPSSILNYFERDDLETKQKFVHTHRLRGHQSFIADLCFFGSSHYLISVGWDSQLLVWHRLLLPSLPKTHTSSSLPHHTIHHGTHHKELSAMTLPLTEVEPVEGFKVGPSASVTFLPLSVHSFFDFGLFVVVRNKLGAVCVLSYARS